MMQCPKCKGNTKVTDSRPRYFGDAIYRRRKCLACGHKFTTWESHKIYQIGRLMIRQKDIRGKLDVLVKELDLLIE